MRSALALPVALAAAALAACGSSGSGTSTTLPPSPRNAGEPCTATAQCASGLVCRSGACDGAVLAGGACGTTAQCSAGLACLLGTCGALAAAPSCPSPGIAPVPGWASAVDWGDPGFGACVSTVRAPTLDPAPDLSVQDLGEHAVDETVSFSVTTGTTSLTIVSQEVNGSAAAQVNLPSFGLFQNTVVPDALKTPSGAVYFDDLNPAPFATAATTVPLVYWGQSPVCGTLTGPNTSFGLDALRLGGGLPPGTWSFLANDWANECTKGACTIPPPGGNTGRYRLHAVTRSAPLAASGALDLEVYLLTDASDGIPDAAAAASNPRLLRWVSSLARFLGRGGICLGTVTFRDLPAWVHRNYPNGTVNVTGEGPCDPLQQLFATSAAPSRGVNLFLAHELVDTSKTPGGTTTVGIDGTIPGPSGFPGTIASGAAVGLFGELGAGSCASTAIDLSACGPDLLAYIAAHEIGHFLGLYHVTEADGQSFDPLTDTAECRRACASSADVTRLGGMPATSCTRGGTCGGGDNLMFWLLDPAASVGNLSRDQGQVVRLNPAVR